MDEQIFVAITRSSSLQSGKRQIVNQYSACTPLDVIWQREREAHPDRWIYLIRGTIDMISAPNPVRLPEDDVPDL